MDVTFALDFSVLKWCQVMLSAAEFAEESHLLIANSCAIWLSAWLYLRERGEYLKVHHAGLEDPVKVPLRFLVRALTELWPNRTIDVEDVSFEDLQDIACRKVGELSVRRRRRHIFPNSKGKKRQSA